MALSPNATAWQARGARLRLTAGEHFYVRVGDLAGAEPVLFLHGFPSSSLDWHAVADRIAAQTRRPLLLPDFLGYGWSDKPRDYSYSLFEQADCVEELCLRLGVAGVHLVAHDVGTSVATELLARRARGVSRLALRSLVMMNGSVHVEMAQLTLSQKLLRRPRLGPIFARLANRRTFLRQLWRILGPDAPAHVDPADLDDMFALIRHDGGHLLLPRIISYIDERYRFAARWNHALTTFDAPALVLWGARDPVAVRAIGERVAGELPRAELRIMERIGHYPQLEDPATVAAAIGAFVARQPA